MKRDLEVLSAESWDILVLGGGITGSWIALDAALRGLSVALIDRGDFCSGSSANSLKIIHGGFRYLRSGQFQRLRRSARELDYLLRAAPHLVEPLPVVVAMRGAGAGSRAAFGAALKAHGLVTRGARGSDRGQPLPNGRTLPAGECDRLLSAFGLGEVGAGMLWYDGLLLDSERLVLSVLHEASERGACLANYVDALSLDAVDRRTLVVRARDLESDQRFDIRAQALANAAGAGAEGAVAGLTEREEGLEIHAAVAWNLVADALPSDVAVGLRSEGSRGAAGIAGKSRYLFAVPWRGRTLLGTGYRALASGGPRAANRRDLESLLAEFNATAPGLDLAWDNLAFYHSGLVPLAGRKAPRKEARLADRDLILDHGQDLAGRCVTVRPAKYTTARRASEEALDRLLRRLRKKTPQGTTSALSLWTAESDPFEPGTDSLVKSAADDLRMQAEKHHEQRLSGESALQLVRLHGGRADEVLESMTGRGELARPLSVSSSVLGCQVVHAVRHEMALHLADVVFRRTGLGSAGCPEKGELAAAVSLMARELGWDGVKIVDEIEGCLSRYRPLRALSAGDVASLVELRDDPPARGDFP